MEDNSIGEEGSGVLRESHSRPVGLAGIEEESSEETRAPRVAARPYAPTKADMAEHYPLHLNYRSWCDDCVHGRATSAHHRSEDRPREGVTWSMDYTFLGKKCEDAEEGEG